jgi:hypothetical protein
MQAFETAVYWSFEHATGGWPVFYARTRDHIYPFAKKIIGLRFVGNPDRVLECKKAKSR